MNKKIEIPIYYLFFLIAIILIFFNKSILLYAALGFLIFGIFLFLFEVKVEPPAAATSEPADKKLSETSESATVSDALSDFNAVSAVADISEKKEAEVSAEISEDKSDVADLSIQSDEAALGSEESASELEKEFASVKVENKIPSSEDLSNLLKVDNSELAETTSVKSDSADVNELENLLATQADEESSVQKSDDISLAEPVQSSEFKLEDMSFNEIEKSSEDTLNKIDSDLNIDNLTFEKPETDFEKKDDSKENQQTAELADMLNIPQTTESLDEFVETEKRLSEPAAEEEESIIPQNENLLGIDETISESQIDNSAKEVNYNIDELLNKIDESDETSQKKEDEFLLDNEELLTDKEEKEFEKKISDKKSGNDNFSKELENILDL